VCYGHSPWRVSILKSNANERGNSDKSRELPARMKLMTKTYTQIVKQIETLKLEADKLRKQEVAGVIARIREAIKFYDLSSADLGLGGQPKGTAAAKPAVKRKKAKAKPARVVKFRNDSGGTWGGIGKRPRWLQEALAAGKSLQDFAVK
jgi:DNA-binding protein H-NS